MKKTNSEGYSDPTAYNAIRAAVPPKEIDKMVSTFKNIASLLGYTIENRIIFRDKRTGKEWR